MRNGAMIEAFGLSKRYGGRVAVDGVSFSVRSGEVFGFLGPNGAGKTTTVRMLLGLVRPSAGRATVGGHDPAKDPTAVRAVVGYLPESFGLYEDMSAFELLDYVGALQGMDARVRRERIDAVLDRFDLLDRRDSPVGAFSKGMRQKVGLARAILNRPRVLFLDEPTSGLDPEAAREVRRLIGDLRREGQTIFLTTHILSEAERVCDSVGFLRRGTLVLEGTLSELRRSFPDAETLEDVYFQVVPEREVAA